MYNTQKNIFNRPLSPHLTIYSSQWTSIYSIWHRITGISLSLILIIYLSILKISVYFSVNYEMYLHFTTSLWIKNLVYIIFTFSIFYHLFNGVRHIMWDLGFILPIKIVSNSAKVLGFFLIGYTLYSIIQIIL